MKKFRHYWTVLAIAAGFFAVSCDDTDEVEVDPTDTTATYDVTLEVDGMPVTPVNVDYNVTSESPEFLKTRVHFTGEDMKRLYITANAVGTGDVVFKPSELNNSAFKADESVGLEASTSEEFDFEFELPVPDSITEGTLVYTFWATSGNGDFRDQNQRLAVGPGTITLKFGGQNPNAAVKVYTDLKLSAPAGTGTSETFVSLLNGEVYTIKPEGITDPTQEEFDEYIAFWDFGYINKQNGGPTLHSTATYPEIAFPNFPQFAASEEPKNNTYFRTSSKTAAEFDEIEMSSQLDFITKPADEFVSNLAAGTVVEFVDQYGKKGLIKVLEAVPGNTPGTHFVRISIKVQP